jgi:hypothetical protein
LIDPIQSVLEFAARYDLIFDETDARLFLENRAALAKDPQNPEAQRIAAHFACVLHRAKDNVTFADFIDEPDCPNDCPECAARNDRYRDRTLQHFATLREGGAAK